MSHKPQLTRADRAYRHEKIVAAYLKGSSSRQLALKFGVTASHARFIVRQAGVSRAAAQVQS